MTKPKRLTTQQLKERGWTPAMIRDLLGPHDATRPSELRVGRRNRLVEAEVKLYNEDRVIQAESTEKFARHQEVARARQDAAEKAQAAKEAGYQQTIKEFLAAPIEGLSRHPNADNMSQNELSEYHARLWFAPELRLARMIRGLPRKLEWQAEGERHKLRLRALYDLYGWPWQDWMKEEKETQE